MIIVILVVIVLIILAIVLNKPSNSITNEGSKDNEEQYNLSSYTSKGYIMTLTELTFYRKLKNITDELELSIFPQVNLERIIQVKDNNFSDRNRIKSRSIDYTIVNNKNCRVVACIELDDGSHYKTSVRKNDEFKNKLFEHVGIPLHRIWVKDNYNTEEIKEMLEKDIKLK